MKPRDFAADYLRWVRPTFLGKSYDYVGRYSPRQR